MLDAVAGGIGRFVLAAVLGLAACNGCHPEWSGTVDVTPTARASVAKCGDGSLTEAGAKLLQRQPHLQNVDTGAATVAWASPPSAGLRVDVFTIDKKSVFSGQAAYSGPRERQQALLARRRTDDVPLPAKDFYLMQATVTGLEAGTLYCYALNDDSGALTQLAPLQTAPAPDSEDPVQFVVLGDTGTGGAAQEAIAKRITEHPFELMLFLGDLAYSRGTPAEIQDRYFAVYADLLRLVPAYVVLGNHENRSDDGAPFRDAFRLPRDRFYYSFDWGNIHFVALDTNRIGPEQARWLERDLAASRATWKIAFGHHPPHSSSRRGSSSAFQAHFVPVLERHKVDLVLSGHEHHYERIGPLGGVVYIVSGGGGGPLTYVAGSKITRTRHRVHHFLHVVARKGTLEVKVIDIEGKEIDEIRLEKAPLTVEAAARPTN